MREVRIGDTYIVTEDFSGKALPGDIGDAWYFSRGSIVKVEGLSEEGDYMTSGAGAGDIRLGLCFRPLIFIEYVEAGLLNLVSSVDGCLTSGRGSERSAKDFLQQASELMDERGKQYDSKGEERSMGKCVVAFNAVTGRDLTESEGWLLMSLLKRVRQYSREEYHKDSAEDGVAYAALEAESLEAAAKEKGD